MIVINSSQQYCSRESLPVIGFVVAYAQRWDINESTEIARDGAAMVDRKRSPCGADAPWQTSDCYPTANQTWQENHVVEMSFVGKLQL